MLLTMTFGNYVSYILSVNILGKQYVGRPMNINIRNKKVSHITQTAINYQIHQFICRTKIWCGEFS